MNTIQIKGSYTRVNRFLKEGGILLKDSSDNKVAVSYKDYLISNENKNNTISRKIRFIYLLENYLFSIDKTLKTFTKENIYDYFNECSKLTLLPFVHEAKEVLDNVSAEAVTANQFLPSLIP